MSQIASAIHATRLAMGSYDVPGGGCRLCCKGDAVQVLPHEDAGGWLTEPHPMVKGARMLAHTANGDCVYLGESGCTTHTDKPQQCHEMDCRRVAAKITLSRSKKLDAKGALPIAVWRRGIELSLASLS